MNSGSKLYDYAHIFKAELYVSEELADSVKKALDALLEIHASSKKEISRINLSPKLTPEGKTDDFQKEAIRVYKAIKNWMTVEDNLAEQVRQLEDKITPRRHDRNDVVWANELREIRDYIKGLDVTEQDLYVVHAAESGDQRIMEAIEFSPVPLKFASQKAIDKIIAARSLLQYPEESVRLADRRRAADELRSARKSVEVELGGLGLRVGERVQDLISPK